MTRFAESKYRAAAQLPRVKIERPEHVIGKDTVPAMKSGIYWGYVGLIEGLTARIRQEYGRPMKVIATGGLATLYAEQGRTDDLKRLAREMLPIFSSLQIHREALAALAYLKQAIETERASLAVVSSVADFLRRARHDPGLRFVAP
mgnify:CR=1 FL=1